MTTAPLPVYPAQAPSWFRNYAVSLERFLRNIDTSSTTELLGINAPNLLDEGDTTYWYYGWTDVGGSWLVQRQTRATGISMDATTGYADLASAWPNRTSLTYV